jgi:hypothetical protein|tara:strand:+ start:335 stop:502 length:168 start_codon:yes stop_codon:yes gene_type:complete
MSGDIPSKTSWVQRLNFTNKSKEILRNFPLSGLKTIAYLALLIYWSIIILGTFAL